VSRRTKFLLENKKKRKKIIMPTFTDLLLINGDNGDERKL
jgi:hypothetical protein